MLIGSVLIQADVVAELSIVDDKKRLVGGHVPTEAAILFGCSATAGAVAATDTVTGKVHPEICICSSICGFFRQSDGPLNVSQLVPCR